MSNAQTVTDNAVTNAVSNATPTRPVLPDPTRPGLQRKEPAQVSIHLQTVPARVGRMDGSLRSLSSIGSRP